MNLHNTSLLGASGPEELVPSRYALKVGEIDVVVVSDGGSRSGGHYYANRYTTAKER